MNVYQMTFDYFSHIDILDAYDAFDWLNPRDTELDRTGPVQKRQDQVFLGMNVDQSTRNYRSHGCPRLRVGRHRRADEHLEWALHGPLLYLQCTYRVLDQPEGAALCQRE